MDNSIKSNVIELNSDNFESEVLASPIPVLVDFFAVWCAPCKMLAPVIEQIAVEAADKAKVGKVNVDEQKELAARYNIRSIPTLVVIKDGKATATAVGARPKSEIIELLGIQF